MPIILCMTKTDMIPDFENHLKNFVPKRHEEDDEELEPGVDRELNMIRSRAGGSKLGSELRSHLGKKGGQTQDSQSQINDEEYDDEEEESCNEHEDEFGMILDLLKGDFAEKLGFQTKAFPVSSKENTGWSDALFHLVKHSVFYEAEESEDD